MKNRLLKLFLVAVVALWGEMPLVGQNNLIVNGDFEQGNTGFYTDYYVAQSMIVGEGCYCIDNSSNGHGGGMLGWPSVSGYGGGKYMIVNGFGGNENASKVVWKQTVSVTSQTNYTFSCQLVNLSRSVPPIIISEPSIIRLKINGVAIGAPFTLPTSNNHDWQEMSHTWNSGDYYGDVDIEIFDVFDGDSGGGDDFGLDQILFVPDHLYDVTAFDDVGILACLDTPANIDVLANDVVLPNANDAVVTIVENPTCGVVEVLSDKRIRYLFGDESHIGASDQFKYRVNNHGKTSEAWVTLSLCAKPSDITLYGIPENHLCVADFVGFSPSATCDENGSPIIDSGWEWATDPNGSWNALSINPFNLPVGNYYLRFWAENDCGRADSEPTPLRICDGPELSATTISDPPMICEGAWLPAGYLAQVGVLNWNNDIGTEGWEVKHGNDDWVPLSGTSLSDGDGLRYRAENCCGEVVTNAVTVHTTQGPEFTGQPYPNPFESYYCLGATLTLPGDHPQYETHGMSTNGFWAYLEGIDYQAIADGTTLTEEWHGRSLTYVLDSDCGGLIPYTEHFTLTVVVPPTVQIVSVATTELCVGQALEVIEPQVDWHHGTAVAPQCGWKYASVTNPTVYVDFDPAEGFSVAGEYYLNYHAENQCGGSDGIPVLVTVNAAPTFADIAPLALSPFCDGEPLVLPLEPLVLGSVENTGWKISVGNDLNGPYLDLPDDLILTQADNGRWLQFYAQGCGDPITKVAQIQVDTKPNSMYSFNTKLCVGQLFVVTPALSDDSWIWKYEDANGQTQEFDPVSFAFDEVGEYLVSYALFNHCSDVNNPEWSVPMPVEVEAGPQFDNSAMPEKLSVCGEMTLSDLLAENALTKPALVDPNVSHNDLGWFLKYKDANNSFVYDPIGLNAIIGMQDDGKELCYGISGDCSDSNIYSKSISLEVLSPSQVMVSGETEVAVMTDFWPGKYYYCVDTEGVEVNWTLTPDIWPHGTEMLGGKSCCWVLVTSVGQAELQADIEVGCGSNVIHINATHFDVDEAEETRLKLYPNPTRHEVNVECEGLQEVCVYDLLGRRLACFSGSENGRLSFCTDTFAPALYLVEIKTDKGLVRRTLSVMN